MPVNYYRSLRPIFFVSKFFGTFPLKRTKSCQFVPSLFWCFYIVIWLIFTTLHVICTPRPSSNQEESEYLPPPKTNETDVTSFLRNSTISAQLYAMEIMNPLILSFMGFCSHWISLFAVRTKLPAFLTDIANIKGNWFSREEIAKSDCIASVVLTVMFMFFNFSVSICNLYASYTEENLTKFIWTAMIILNGFSSHTSEIQFLFFAISIYTRFKSINKYLKLQGADNMKKWPYLRTNKIFNCPMTVQSIEMVHISHRKLCDLFEDLNEIYNIQLICTMAGCFLKTLFNLYLTIFGSFVSNKSSSYSRITTVLWTIYYIKRFLIVTIIASSASTEAAKTSSIISAANCRLLSYDVKEELVMFLSHLNSRKVKFSACGLVTINTKLITSALAAGTTYLVILVQFRP